MNVKVNGMKKLYEIKVFNKTTRGNVDADVIYRCRVWEHEVMDKLFELRQKYMEGYYFLVEEI